MRLKKGTVIVDGHVEKYEISSGNVFADLGLPNPEELQLKSELVSRIDKLMKTRSVTQTELAKMAGIRQPRVSRLLGGHLDEVSVERLLRIINCMGHRVELHISEAKYAPAQAQTVVVGLPRKAGPSPAAKRSSPSKRPAASVTRAPRRTRAKTAA